MLKNQSQNLMQLKTDAENECSNNKQSQNLKLRRSKKLRQSQKLNLLLPLQKLIQSQKLKLLQPLQKLAVTKASTAVTKAHAVTKAQNLINRPLQKLESPISGRNPRKYKNLQRSHVFLQQCYVFRGIHEYIAHTYFG
jgi:hypothetical protein